MPANICYSPIRVSLDAGYSVIFYNPTNLSYDCAEVVKIANSDKTIKAILLPKLYGYSPKNIESLKQLDSQRTWLIIEDMAQTFGNSFIDNDQNNITLVTIYSFGESKFIEKFQAGLLVTKNHDFFQNLIKIYNDIPILSDELHAKIDSEDEYDKLQARLSGDWHTYYKKLVKTDSRRFILKKQSTPKIKIQQNWVEDKKQNVFNKSVLFLQKLSRVRDLIVPHEGDFNRENPVWRFTIRLEEARRNKLISVLRAKNLPVSAWYQAVPYYLGLVDSNRFEESLLFERQVVNFWVNEKINTQYINTVVKNL
jgi:dTDP-4-amino-4,6-dideoxygalactose transaminase